MPALVGVVAALDAAAAACELEAEDARADEDDEVEGRKPEPGGDCKRQGISQDDSINGKTDWQKYTGGTRRSRGRSDAERPSRRPVDVKSGDVERGRLGEGVGYVGVDVGEPELVLRVRVDLLHHPQSTKTRSASVARVGMCGRRRKGHARHRGRRRPIR